MHFLLEFLLVSIWIDIFGPLLLHQDFIVGHKCLNFFLPSSLQTPLCNVCKNVLVIRDLFILSYSRLVPEYVGIYFIWSLWWALSWNMYNLTFFLKLWKVIFAAPDTLIIIWIRNKSLILLSCWPVFTLKKIY